MKTVTLYLKALLLLTLIQAETLTSLAQPAADYSFTSFTLLSGTDKAVGAVYRFTNVKSGVDAIVTITGAVNATLATLDQTGQGWNAAFQPNITVPSMKNGYIEFKIEFVNAGTFTKMHQPQVAATAMDIDGYNFAANQKLYEYEQFDMGFESYVEYEFTGTDISMSYIGSAIRGTNVGGVDYGSINQSPNVRFTVFRSNVTTIYVRSGANNLDVFNNVTRQRSFYFARFTYPNSRVILGASDLQSFTASSQKQSVQLNWELAASHSVDKMEVERSAGDESFKKIATVTAPATGVSSYTDNAALAGINCYRIKLYGKDGKSFYSKIVKVNTSTTATTQLQVFPTICTDQTTVVISSDQKSAATIRLIDNNGRVFLTRKVTLNEGSNSIPVELGDHLPQGNYTVIADVNKKRYTGKLIKAIR